MKKIVAVLLATVVLFAFAGCGAETQDNYEVPIDGMYHEGSGILLLVGMAEEEMDQLFAPYGEAELIPYEDMRAKRYPLGDLFVGFSNNKAVLIFAESGDWEIWKGVHVGSTMNDVRKEYGLPQVNKEVSSDSDERYWAYVSDSNIQHIMHYKENEDRVYRIIVSYSYWL